MFKIKNFLNVILKIAKDMKDFLLKPKSKEFFLYMFFCGVATIFWFMLTLNENHKEHFQIPVHVSGMPSDLILTNTPDSILMLSVTARGTTILDYKIRHSSSYSLPIELKFDSLKLISHKNHIKFSTGVLQKHINQRFKDADHVDILSPDSLEYIYAKSEGKKIPVHFNGSLEASSQHYIVEQVLIPDSVEVYAPSSLLRSIKEAQLDVVRINDISDNKTFSIVIPPTKGVKYNPESVEMRVIVDAVTEKTVAVPIVGVGFPYNKSLLTFPSEVFVTFQVGTKRFNSITSADFQIELAYQDVLKQKEGYLSIQLTKIPSGIKHIRLSHKSVDFLIEDKNKN